MMRFKLFPTVKLSLRVNLRLAHVSLKNHKRIMSHPSNNDNEFYSKKMCILRRTCYATVPLHSTSPWILHSYNKMRRRYLTALNAVTNVCFAFTTFNNELHCIIQPQPVRPHPVKHYSTLRIHTTKLVEEVLSGRLFASPSIKIVDGHHLMDGGPKDSNYPN